MKTLDLVIAGMNCGHCVMSVKKELGKLDGVQVESVEIGTGRIAYDESRVSPRQIEAAIENAGFHLVPPQPAL